MMWLTTLLSLPNVGVAFFFLAVVSASKSQHENREGMDLATDAGHQFTPALMPRGEIGVGQVNCQYESAPTPEDVDATTCQALADKYLVSIDTIFLLNPSLKRDCSNVKPNTQYCVKGYIQEMISTDGYCGTPHNNATCLENGKRCCNSETWKCGNGFEDCRPGTCWGNTCPDPPIYSLDGQCGVDYQGLLCAGKWGNCCGIDGFCRNCRNCTLGGGHVSPDANVTVGGQTAAVPTILFTADAAGSIQPLTTLSIPAELAAGTTSSAGAGAATQTVTKNSKASRNRLFLWW
ncbi:hypothetical protein B0H63DRAFT_563576 [Podospora didyma]|uniref:LysM domain-containing protein n=1 Tax=Podospora didyma TaxID=330526 RepID=A0AAE0N797_9PEZI|nr:hypothetical protein B0H63DRAFT_563576 [Podospora didyma]